MKRKIFTLLIAVTMLSAVLLLSGCGEKGLDIAYEDLKNKFDDTSKAQFKYSKKSDTLSISITACEDINLDELFDILDDDLEEADVGNLSFTEIKQSPDAQSQQNKYPDNSNNNVLPNQNQTPAITLPNKSLSSRTAPDSEYMKKFCKRLGQLKCGSLRCLDISGVFSTFNSEKWTKVLKKVNALYIQPAATSTMINYSDKAKKRFSKVKKLWLPAASTTESFGNLTMFTNLEEINFSAGLTKESREAAKQKGLTFTYSTFGTIADAVPVNKLKDLKNLKRLLVMPEVKDWTPNDNCYSLYLVAQACIPEVKTNAPGTKWNLDDGSDDDLVALKDIDVFATAEEIAKKNDSKAADPVGYSVYTTLENVLKPEASACYNTGKKFKEKGGTPKLRGNCLVYLAYPNDLSGTKGTKWNKEAFYSGRANVLVSELKKSKVSIPKKAGDYDTFVYIYPRFTKYGNYDKGTEGFTQSTNVRVYNMKKKIRYKAVVADTVKPAQQFRYYGAVPKIHYEDIRVSNVVKYLNKLAK